MCKLPNVLEVKGIIGIDPKSLIAYSWHYYIELK